MILLDVGWLLALGFGLMAGIMGVLFLRQTRSLKADNVDIAWSAGIGLLAGLYLLGSAPLGTRQWLAAGLCALWSGRLALHLWRRAEGREEDGRYASLRAHWGAKAQRNFAIFYQVQAFWAVLFSLPALVAIRNRAPLEDWQAGLALGIFALAIGGEALADAQLERWRRAPENRGKTCRTGLWKLSRHPNYFFEWLGWFGYLPLALGSSWWWVTLAAAGLMLVFLFRVTGIPYTEQQALRSRGADYRRYQREVSAFLPLPPGQWLTGLAIAAMERGLVPDALIRAGIRRLNRQRLAEEASKAANGEHQELCEELVSAPLAVETEAANEQHYEVPAGFFTRVLGKHLKYSCCWFEPGAGLDTAEAAMLERYCERAGLADGQRILELGCGWGSLSLFMAARYPGATITVLSNSSSQRAFIEGEMEERGLTNLTVLTRDINDFAPEERFDRVVSIEMFEHVRNHTRLLRSIASWLEPDGRLFVHIFCHRAHTYLFQAEGEDNWMGRTFFSGGMMPAADFLPGLDAPLDLEDSWRVGGEHYQQTAEAWLVNLDARKREVMPVLRETYGADAERWFQRWRIFFLACAELFGFDGGREWHVMHYLFAPAPVEAPLMEASRAA